MTDKGRSPGEERSLASVLGAAMRTATELSRNQNVVEATHLIRRALAGRGHPRPLDGFPRDMPALVGREPDAALSPRELASDEPSRGAPTARPRRPLGTVLELLHRPELSAPGLGIFSAPAPRKHELLHAPDGAAYLTRHYACAAGARDYRLYVPAAGPPRTLVVMLHGCTQTPDDFAAGTAMNALAEELRLVVAYPWQPTSANQSGCWNWFKPQDQARDAGEPAIIAGLTRALVHEYDIDSARVFVAGLSAGGAMAAVLAATYPDLYRAAGIHSGLAHGAASDLVSALAAMRGTPFPVGLNEQSRPVARSQAHTRTIVFHGTADQTVHPSNADAICASARDRLNGAAETEQHGRSSGGLSYTRKIVTDSKGCPQLEHWRIDGLGHAWSGGRPDGSYTDSLGPDASREMVRFFLAAEPGRH